MAWDHTPCKHQLHGGLGEKYFMLDARPARRSAAEPGVCMLSGMRIGASPDYRVSLSPLARLKTCRPKLKENSIDDRDDRAARF
jgi:hypothetical protein